MATCALTPVRAQLFCNAIGGPALDNGQSMVQASDGGYAMAGYTSSFGAGSNDFYVVKLTGAGALQWTSTTGGANNDEARCIVQTSDGGYAVAGYTSSFGAGSYDLYVVKLNAAGALQWTRTIGGATDDFGTAVVQTTDGGLAVAGYTTSYGAGSHDFYVVKLDALGALQWTRTVGGANAEQAWSIVQTADGGYAVAGYTLSYGAGDYDFYVVKLDAAGGLLWTSTIGGASLDQAWSLVQTTDGGYAVAGYTTSFGAGNHDFYMMKLDAAGVLQWTRTVGGALYDLAYSIVQTTDGGYALAGATTSFGTNGYDFYVVRLDGTGMLLWSKTIGGPSGDFGSTIVQTTDGGFAVSGSTNSSVAGLDDFYVVKMDAAGNMCCTFGSGGATGNGGAAVTGGSAGSGGTTGNGGTVSSGGSLTASCVVLPVALLYFNAVPENNHVRTYWSTASEANSHHFAVLRSQDAVAFELVGTVPAGGNSTVALDYSFYDEHPLAGLSYYQLAQVDSSGQSSVSDMVAVYRAEFDIVNIYPNPAKGVLQILIGSPSTAEVSVVGYNVLGQILFDLREHVVKGHNVLSIDVGMLPTGIYTMKVSTPAGEHAESEFMKQD